MIEWSVTLVMVRIIACWYQTQTMCVKWGEINSAYFNVSNGVRQGGVLSPKLFAIYVDDLSFELTLCKSESYINDQCMNHVMHADDIKTPSAIGLQKMLDVCFNFSLRNDIMFNPVKSVCVTFKSRNSKLSCPNVRLDSNILECNNQTKCLGLCLARMLKMMIICSHKWVHCIFNHINWCLNFSLRNDIMFDPVKSVCVTYKPKNSKLLAQMLYQTATF